MVTTPWLLPVSAVGNGDDRRGRPLVCTDRLVVSLFKRNRHSHTSKTQKTVENQSVHSYKESPNLNTCHFSNCSCCNYRIIKNYIYVNNRGCDFSIYWRFYWKHTGHHEVVQLLEILLFHSHIIRFVSGFKYGSSSQ